MLGTAVAETVRATLDVQVRDPLVAVRMKIYILPEESVLAAN